MGVPWVQDLALPGGILWWGFSGCRTMLRGARPCSGVQGIGVQQKGANGCGMWPHPEGDERVCGFPGVQYPTLQGVCVGVLGCSVWPCRMRGVCGGCPSVQPCRTVWRGVGVLRVQDLALLHPGVGLWVGRVSPLVRDPALPYSTLGGESTGCRMWPGSTPRLCLPSVPDPALKHPEGGVCVWGVFPGAGCDPTAPCGGSFWCRIPPCWGKEGSPG